MKSIILTAAATGVFLIAGGCDRPESTPEELGTVVKTLPEIPNRPDSLPIPEGVDDNCAYTARQEIIKRLENPAPAADSASEADQQTDADKQ